MFLPRTGARVYGGCGSGVQWLWCCGTGVEVVCSANVFSKACVFDLVATEACVERGQRFPKTKAGNFTLFAFLWLIR